MKSQTSATTYVLWAVFIGLLIVLLPHTAWAFRNWEPLQAVDIAFGVTSADIISYVAAFAFESAIAVLTHKLSKHIELTPKSKKGAKRFLWQYVNPISFALVIATVVSSLANLAHAVEFGRPLKIFAEWGIPYELYSLAFGGILPLVSLTFARVLSNVVDDEDAPNPEIEEAKKTILSIRQQLRDTEGKLKDAESRAKLAEDRFAAMGDVVKYLFGEDKKQRIIISRKQWPQLPGSAISIIAQASPAYVSEVLKEIEA